MIEHTEEPWFLFLSRDFVSIYDKDPSIHEDAKEVIHWSGFDSATVEEKARANARRIVACLNALEDISVEALEDGTLKEFLDSMELAPGGIHFKKPYGTTRALLAKLKEGG